MKKKTNVDWEFPSIYDIIDRMSFKWLLGDEEEKPKSKKESVELDENINKKSTKKMTKKKVKDKP